MFRITLFSKILLFIGLLTCNLSYAEPHYHGNRAHSHPLPKQGVNHRHGNSKYGTKNGNSVKKQNSTQNSEFIALTANDRSKYIKTFSRTSFVNREECIISLCGKIISIRNPGYMGSDFRIRDYDNLRKNDLEPFRWYKGNAASGMQIREDFLTYELYKVSVSRDYSKVKFTLLDKKSGNEKSSKVFYKVMRNTQAGTSKAEVKILRALVRHDDLNVIDNNKFFNDKLAFLTNHKIDKSVSPSLKFYKNGLKSNNTTSISGNGVVKFSINKNYTADIKVTGNFNNGKLVNNGELNVVIEKCYKRPLLSCEVSEDESFSRTINQNSNVSSLIDKFATKVLPKMNLRGSNRVSRLNSSSSQNSSCDYLSSNRDRNMCIGVSGKIENCDYLSSNRDRNMCKGMSGQTSNCDYLSSSRDRNMCIGVSGKTENCDYLSSNRDRNMCKGMSGQTSNCDYLSSNRDRNMCKGSAGK